MEFIISTHACFFIKYNKNLFYLEPREGIRAGAGAKKPFFYERLPLYWRSGRDSKKLNLV